MLHRVLERAFVSLGAAVLLASCSRTPNQSTDARDIVPVAATLTVARHQTSRRQMQALKIVAAARTQVGDLYDASYVDMKYPNGDVPRGRGACTDVIVRALRAVGYDLQKLIHEDKKRHPSVYPAKWRASRADTNIDQRRVPNQKVFFARYGKTLTNVVNSSTRNQWQAGDIVQWKFENGLDHTGIISDKLNAQGWPLVIHNVDGCAENDVLTAWKIVGHYRFPMQ